MHKSTLIVMALPEEGQGKLETLGYEVIYCGIGKVNAAYALMQRLASGDCPPLVLNLGSAGSHHFLTGELVEVTELVQRDMDLTGLGFERGCTPFEEDPALLQLTPAFPSLPQGRCGTGDSFLQNACVMGSQLVDMEAYALAKICARKQLTFQCVKYITDGADHAASQDWQTNLCRAADAFVQLLKVK